MNRKQQQLRCGRRSQYMCMRVFILTPKSNRTLHYNFLKFKMIGFRNISSSSSSASPSSFRSLPSVNLNIRILLYICVISVHFVSSRSMFDQKNSSLTLEQYPKINRSLSSSSPTSSSFPIIACDITASTTTTKTTTTTTTTKSDDNGQKIISQCPDDAECIDGRCRCTRGFTWSHHFDACVPSTYVVPVGRLSGNNHNRNILAHKTPTTTTTVAIFIPLGMLIFVVTISCLAIYGMWSRKFSPTDRRSASSRFLFSRNRRRSPRSSRHRSCRNQKDDNLMLNFYNINNNQKQSNNYGAMACHAEKKMSPAIVLMPPRIVNASSPLCPV